MILSTVNRVLVKLSQVITSFILKSKRLSKLHKLAVKISYLWHPYVEDYDVRVIDLYNWLISTASVESQVRLTTTGVLQVYTEAHVYMIPCGVLSRESLIKNFDNYQKLKDTEYQRFVNYDLQHKNVGGLSYYSMEKLRPITDPLEFMHSFTSAARSQNCADLLSAVWLESANLKVRQYCGVDLSAVVEILKGENLVLHVGLTHGDLTSSNMLKGRGQNFVLIDLDRVDFNGFQFIDSIHFLFEWEAEQSQRNWLLLLMDAISRQIDPLSHTQRWPKEQLALYFLYRVNSELRNDITPSPYYSNLMADCGRSLLSYYCGQN